MFSGYKTYITAGLGIIGAIAAYFVGDVSLVAMLQTVFTALIGIFLRSGINASVQKVTDNVASTQTAVNTAASLSGVGLSDTINGQ